MVGQAVSPAVPINYIHTCPAYHYSGDRDISRNHLSNLDINVKRIPNRRFQVQFISCLWSTSKSEWRMISIDKIFSARRRADTERERYNSSFEAIAVI